MWSITHCKLIRFLATVAITCTCLFELLGCQSTPRRSDTGTSTGYDLRREKLYVERYLEWKKSLDLRLSGESAYIDVPEFAAIVACGRPVVPFLYTKLKEGEGIDLYLSVAVMRILGWDEYENFEKNDSFQKLRDYVIKRLESQ